MKPELTGSEECDDLFDHASHVVRLTLAEAKRWFVTGPCDPPGDLIKFLGHSSSKTEGGLSEPVKPDRRPLTELQREVWKLLSGQILMAKELASRIPGGSHESAITKMIKRMVDNGYPIVNVHTRGYYRKDSPPKDLTGHPTDSD